MHNAAMVEKNDEHCFDFPFLETKFAALAEFSPPRSELWRLVSGSYAKYQLSSPIIIESKNSRSFLIISGTSHICATHLSCCSVVSAWGTNLVQIFRFFKLSCKIRCTMVFNISIFPIIWRSTGWSSFTKPAIHLSFLAFWYVRALFHGIVNQSLYTSHNIADFVHLWFCEKLDECTNGGVKSYKICSRVRCDCGVF